MPNSYHKQALVFSTVSPLPFSQTAFAQHYTVTKCFNQDRETNHQCEIKILFLMQDKENIKSTVGVFCTTIGISEFALSPFFIGESGLCT